jgi:hypothetical protein
VLISDQQESQQLFLNRFNLKKIFLFNMLTLDE